MLQPSNNQSPIATAPAYVVLLVLCCALFLNSRNYSIFYALFASILFGASWMLAGEKKMSSDRITMFIFLLTLSFLFSFYSLLQINKKNILPSTIETTGKVLINRQWGKSKAILIKTKCGKLVAYTHGSLAPEEGSRVVVRGALFDFKGAGQNKKKFDENLFWRSKGAIKKIVILELAEISPPSGVYRWRNYLREIIKDKLPTNLSAYMLALTVGEKDKALSEIHRKVGTSHLLAVSGFHIGLLALISTLFLRRGKKKIIGTTLLIWGAVLLTGLPPGAVRAALMLQIFLIGLLLGKPKNAFNSVAIAGILMLLFNPWSFYDISWRLSMLATIFLSSVINVKWFNLSRICIPSILVWFATAPLVSISFQEVPLAGTLINIIAVPLFAILFPIIILVSIPLLIDLPFAKVLAAPAECVLEAWNIFSNIFAKVFPWSIISTLPLIFTSVFIIVTATAFASGMSPKKSLFIGVILASTFLLLI